MQPKQALYSVHCAQCITNHVQCTVQCAQITLYSALCTLHNALFSAVLGDCDAVLGDRSAGPQSVTFLFPAAANSALNATKSGPTSSLGGGRGGTEVFTATAPSMHH